MGTPTIRPTLQQDSFFARTSKNWPARYPRTSPASTRASSKATAEVPPQVPRPRRRSPLQQGAHRPRQRRCKPRRRLHLQEQRHTQVVRSISRGPQADAGLLPQHPKQLKATSAPAAVDTSNGTNAAAQAAAAATSNALKGGHFAFCVHPQKEHTYIGHNVEL
jgi:hypothetical protein